MARKSKNDHFVVLDGGRSLVKAKTQSKEDSFTHAIAQITESEYNKLNIREPDPLAMKINGVPFAIGERAIKRGYQARLTTANRYNEIYYGSLVAAMLYRLYDKPINNVFLYSSHPPVAVEYRQDIIAAAKGTWKVEGANGKNTYKVTDVRCFDEPVGGVMNLLLAQDGKSYQRSDIKKGSTFVIDIGGQTIDVAALDNGTVDYSSIASSDGGIIEIEQRFEELLRSEYRKWLQGTNYIPPQDIRNAIHSGIFDAGAYGEWDVKEIVHHITGDVLVRIASLIDEYGSMARYNNIVLTGGGGGLLFSRICEYFDHAGIINRLGRKYFHLADDLEDVHMANVRGGFKLLKMFQSAGRI